MLQWFEHGQDYGLGLGEGLESNTFVGSAPERYWLCFALLSLRSESSLIGKLLHHLLCRVV